ncbi:hypothetical protein CBL_13079 [Carabus blaptoides fortunei]
MIPYSSEVFKNFCAHSPNGSTIRSNMRIALGTKTDLVVGRLCFKANLTNCPADERWQPRAFHVGLCVGGRQGGLEKEGAGGKAADCDTFETPAARGVQMIFCSQPSFCLSGGV